MNHEEEAVGNPAASFIFDSRAFINLARTSDAIIARRLV
jgi:hypothetical protein